MKRLLFWLRFLPTPWIVNMATLFRLGYVGKAPGTLGSAAGLIWFTAFFFHLPLILYFLLLLVTVFLAVLICEEGEKRMAKTDPPEMILDEMVAIPICFLGLQPVLYGPRAWAVIGIGFLLFRIFDIVKPFGIRRLQEMPGGQGVVADDVAAALVTCGCLHVIVALVPALGP